MDVQVNLTSIFVLFAEREGFEPPVQLPVHRISSAAHSTTLASFRKHCKDRTFFLFSRNFLPKKLLLTNKKIDHYSLLSTIFYTFVKM